MAEEKHKIEEEGKWFGEINRVIERVNWVTKRVVSKLSIRIIRVDWVKWIIWQIKFGAFKKQNWRVDK